MISPNVASNAQAPTLSVAPKGAVAPSSDVEVDVERVLRWAGLVLDDWQESLLFESLRPQSDGLWAAGEVCVVVPRQNGKGALMEARQLVGLFVLGEKLQVHTAHEFKTAYEHFRRVKGLVEQSDELFEQVRIIRTGAGDQAIELHSGERLRFLARSKSAIRGFSADVVYFDEAFELPIETVGSVLPALSARPNPQVWYCSSAPHANSEFLHSVLKRADVGDTDRLLLRSWENDRDVVLDDVEAWRRANPALGIRIDEDFVHGEMETLCATPAGIREFKRERLGVRESLSESGIVDLQAWHALSVDDVQLSKPCYGLSVAPDGRWSSIGAAGRTRDGLLYVDNVRMLPGTGSIVAAVAELCKRKRTPIRVNPAAAEGAFIQALTDAGVEVVEVDARSYQQACGAFLAAVTNGELRHPDDVPLDRSVAAAGRREVGKEGAWVWEHPANDVDISPLSAATLALSGVAEAPKFFVY